MSLRAFVCCLLLVAGGAIGGVGATPPGLAAGTAAPAASQSSLPAGPTLQGNASAGEASANATEATPTATPQSVAGSLSPGSPPANTVVEHTLALEFVTPVANGTTVLFPDAYERGDLRVRSVDGGNTGNDTSVGGRLTTTQGRPGIELTATGDVRDVAVGVTARHPDVENETRFEVAVGDTESVVEYRVRPVGPDRRSGPTGEFDRAGGSGFVYANATVYQGERDIAFRGRLTEPLRGVTGDTAGVLLEPPVPTDAATGTYSVDGANDTASVQVREPKITTLRLENDNGADVTDGTVYADNTDTVTVIAQSNFEQAEHIELTVRNGRGLDVTGELINTSAVRAETATGRPATGSARVASLTGPPSAAASGGDGRTDAAGDRVATTRASGTASVGGFAGAGGNQVEAGAAAARPVPSISAFDDPGPTSQGDTFEVTYTITNSGGEDSAALVEFPDYNLPDGVTVDAVDGDVDQDLLGSSPPAVITDNVPAGGGTVSITVTYAVSDSADTGDQAFDVTATMSAGDSPYSDTAGSTVRIEPDDAGSEVGSSGRVRWHLDLSAVETPTVTVTVTGSDDLDEETANSSAGLTVSQETPSLSLSNASPNRGQRPTVTVTNGVYGAEYVVGVDASDLRNDLPTPEYYSVFRNVGTTREVGVITRSGEQFTGGEPVDGKPATVYARVRVDPDDGTGETQLETSTLGETATLELLERTARASGLLDDARPADSAELTVGDPAITLSGPDSYVPGEETTLRGTAEAGVDTMVVYARSNASADFELVDLDGSVDGELAGLSVSGSFGRDVDLSSGDGPGNTLLSLPGTYRVAPLPRSDLVDERSAVPETLAPAAVLAETPALHTVTVTRPAVTVERPGLDGRLAATASTIEVSGSVTGRESALLVAIGDRGALTAETVGGPNFTDVDLRVESFPEGRVTLFVVSSGRDGQVGDGSIRDARIASADSPLGELESHLQSVAETRRNGDQLRAILRNETDRDTASDDPVASETFRIVPANVEITSPEPNATVSAGTPVTVTGRTTVPPRVAPLDVSVARGVGTDAERRVRQWSNATWETTIPTGNLASGRHRITARIGDTVATREVVVVDGTAARAPQSQTSGDPNTGGAEQTPTEGQPTGATALPAASPAPPGTASPAGPGTASPAPGTETASNGGQSGLGTLPALGVVAFLVAILALRYRNG